MITVYHGPKAIGHTYQTPFNKTEPCSACGGKAKLAFVYLDDGEVSKLKSGKRWPHDAVAVAVYFCTECLKPLALFNQA